MTQEKAAVDIDLGAYKLGWHDEEDYVFKPRKGLNEEIIREMSSMKDEPQWMLEFRLKAYQRFLRKPVPKWGGGGKLDDIDFDDIYYYIKPTEGQAKSWDMVPDSIKETYEKLGIPEAERKYLAGVTAQYESEVVYHRNREDLEAMGVLFCDTDTAVRDYPEIVQEYFGKIIPPNDNKFAALNSAVWSGGSFIYVPPGVHVDQPLQAYFRINAENMGQFERTLIIVDEGASVDYVEGCLPAGELVSMADGDFRPIEEITVGDHVLGGDGRPLRVKAKQVRDYWGPMYTFRPVSPDNSFRVTEEHPVLVVRRKDVRVKRAARNGWKPEVSTEKLLAAEPEWIEAKDVQEGDFLAYPKPRPAPANTVLPIELARLAGYYLADGWAGLTNGAKCLSFSLHIDDTESVDEIRRLCKELYGAEGSVYWNEERNEASVLVYTAAGYEAMRSHVGFRSHLKRLSPEFFGQDTEFLRNLVETYLRGDGNITKRGDARWMRAHTTSRIWAHQLQAIMARLDVYATVRLERLGGPAEIMGRQVTRHDLFNVQWTEGGNGPREVRDAGTHFLVPIKSIQVEAFGGAVYNLDVPEPDSYLAGGFAVHNCSAPVYSTDSLHSAVVEIVVKEGARCRYTTIQNWSPNVYNLVTKRAAAYRNATMEWIDANIGCLAEGSTVTTPAGVKPIEELVPGEEVLSFDEALGGFAFRRVTAKRFSGLQPVREVRSGVRSLRVTDNHPFYSDIDGTRCYVRADRLVNAAVPAPIREPALVGADGAGGSFKELPESVEIRKVEVSEPLEVVPTWDIEVEGTGNFVSEGFIVHNSRLTMKYPSVWLMEPGAHGEVLSMAYAGEGQHQDAGAKMVHAAPDTTSLITSKSISKDGGRGGYRGLVRVEPGAEDVRSFVRCDALILDEDSRSDTYPYMEIEEADAQIEHEAYVSKVGDDQLFYLMSRGLTEEEATAMIVAGFIEPVVKVLPMEYAVELNRLVELQMVGSVG